VGAVTLATVVLRPSEVARSWTSAVEKFDEVRLALTEESTLYPEVSADALGPTVSVATGTEMEKSKVPATLRRRRADTKPLTTT
jgi:hypothetical protein